MAFSEQRWRAPHFLSNRNSPPNWRESVCWVDPRSVLSAVLVGAVVTAFLFNIGKFLIGLYIGSSAVASSYGAAGALVVALLWIYYSAQIFLLGAEVTKVSAH